jgi:uncharacterized protein (TIGR02996 family)
MPTMLNAHAFIESIREAPDDDTHRLVFADWLTDHGESARAELIRVQCELARLPTVDPRYPELHLRQLELIAEHETEWLGDWADRLVRWEFRRGLLHSVTITEEPFVEHGVELFRDHPVERVALVDKHGESLSGLAVARVVAAPAMGEVRALETAGCRRDEPMCAMYGGQITTNTWLAALARANHLTRLEALHLNGDTRMGRETIDLKVWREFCEARHLRTLRRLDLSSSYHPDQPPNLVDVTHILARAVFAENLRSLSLAGAYLGDEAARHLAEAPFGNLEELDLGNCDTLRAEGLRALLSPSVLPRLRSLTIPYTLPLEELAALPFLAQLSALLLSGNSTGGSTVTRDNWSAALGRRVDASEWESLFRSPHLNNLTELSVGVYNELPPHVITGLLQAPWTASLRSLTLGSENLSAEDLAPLFARPVQGPTPLRSLCLRDCEGIGAALADWPGLAGITELTLTRTYAQECKKDTATLLQSPHLSPRLERLDLSGSCNTPANVKRLANRPALAGLRWLGFCWNDIRAAGMRLLLRSPHLRNLESLHLSSEHNTDALATLSRAEDRPRLRDVVVGSGTPRQAITRLRERFGPRLRVWSDC